MINSTSWSTTYYDHSCKISPSEVQEPKHIYISGSLLIQTLDALDPLDELEYIGLLDQLHYIHYMIMFIFDGKIFDNNKRALNALIELDYIGLLDQLHYMKEVPRRPTKTETSKCYQISG